MTKFTDIHGITFAPFAPAGSLSQDCARQSLRLMKERTNADFIILVPGGLQDTPQSENINYTSEYTMTDHELRQFIGFAQS